METGAPVIALWPHWLGGVGEMRRMQALVRSRCAACGALLRVDLDDLAARHGDDHSLVDRLERCRVVGCAGSAFYLASRTYGQPWATLLRDPVLIESFAALPPVRMALG